MAIRLVPKSTVEEIGEEVVKTLRLLVITINITIVTFFVLETFKSGLISNTINLNSLIIAQLFSLLIIIIFGDRLLRRQPRKRWLAPGLLISILSGLAVLFISDSFGLISLFMALLVTVIAYIVWYSYVYEV